MHTGDRSIGLVQSGPHYHLTENYLILIWFMVFDATFNNILVIYRGGQFYWWRKPGYPEKTTDL